MHALWNWRTEWEVNGATSLNFHCESDAVLALFISSHANLTTTLCSPCLPEAEGLLRMQYFLCQTWDDVLSLRGVGIMDYTE